MVQHRRLRRTEERLLLLCSPGLNITMCQLVAGSKSEFAMKFYYCTTAPSPRRVRIFIAEKGIAVPTIQVDLRNGEQFSPAFRAINPEYLLLSRLSASRRWHCSRSE
jgi:hypothetical protein